jgi:coproporphyrinogen III oxidase
LNSFPAQIDSAEEGTPTMRLLHRHDRGARFRLQFGREVCSSLLQVPHRADWKACVVPQAAEEAATTKFKEKFKSFDFTLEE